GVSRYDGKSFTNFTTAQGLANNYVYSITEDKTGILWFGTDGGGVSRYDGKSFTNFTTAQGLANNYVYSITEDKTGILWFGTAGGGVSVLIKAQNPQQDTLQLHSTTLFCSTAKLIKKNDKPGSHITVFYTITVKDGLADNVIYGIREDKQGKIIIGTNLGLTVLVPLTSTNNNRMTTNDHRITIFNQTYSIEIYNNNTGYPVKDVNGGSANGAMLCDSKGIIWAGTGDDKTALVCFDHNAVIKSKQPPPVILQSIKVNNENICWYAMKAQSSKVKGKSSKVKGKSSKEAGGSLNYPALQGGGKKTPRDSSGFSPKQNEDSLALINESVLTFGKTLSTEILDAMQQKFAGIKFDGITKFYPLPENLVLPYSHNNVSFEFNAVIPARHHLVRYQYMLEGYDDDWSPVTDKTTASFGNIYEGTYTFKVKACSPDGVWSRDAVCYVFTVLPPWYRTWWMYAVYVLVLGYGFWVLVKWRERKLKREKAILEDKVKLRTAQLQQANEEITTQRDEITAQRDLVTQQKDEIEAQRDLVTKQKEHIEHIHEELTDSIRYAERIQNAVLPGEQYIMDILGMGEWASERMGESENIRQEAAAGGSLPVTGYRLPITDYFILFKPKDIVSGDFYWFTKRDKWLLITVADCTGHGVPGAFMSMLGISFLNEIIAREEIQSAGGVLDELRRYVIHSLQQKGAEGEQQDGMDIAFIALNCSPLEKGVGGFDTYELQYAGANNPLYIVTSHSSIVTGKNKQFETNDQCLMTNDLLEVKADKMPIGIYQEMLPFKNNTIKVNKGDTIYLASDGYEDQFGGEKRKKFLNKRFKESLLQIAHLPMQEQREALNTIFENWKGKGEQIDDVTVMGIRV
ncbi:MAG: SpoIIE family protein phosphatase, partial [Bacteroidia bacterium]|nr:SpoIIE family protein phosphatase [Bacteroidia bacterium]